MIMEMVLKPYLYIFLEPQVPVIDVDALDSPENDVPMDDPPQPVLVDLVLPPGKVNFFLINLYL